MIVMTKNLAFWYTNNKLLESCKHFISVPSQQLKGANSTTFLCTVGVTHMELEVKVDETFWSIGIRNGKILY